MAKELKPIDSQKLSDITAKLTALDTPQGRTALASEKIAALSAVENELSDSMRWLVNNLKARWQAQDAALIAMEKQALQTQKAELESQTVEKPEA